MGEWRKLRIGDICDIVKGETGLASATPGKYPMVATGADRRSCNTYQFDTEAVCIPLVSSTGHGKKTLNYVHYQSGKFALGTILAAVIPKDKKVLTARYLHLYLSHFKDTVLVPLMKGAANVSLPMKGIATIEIPVPPVDQQQKLMDLIGRIESEHHELLKEGTHQAGLFKQLRQSVLQEAAEGKLTASWRKQHPVTKGDPQHDAAALLAQIKAEKERLVKAGKIRKEKPLEPIVDADKPLELPAGWGWVRLGNVCSKITDGTHHSPINTTSGDYKYITAKNIKDSGVDISNISYVSKEAHEEIYKRRNVELGDVLFIKDGATTGIVTVSNIDEQFSILSSVALLKPLIVNRYLMFAMRSPFFYSSARDQMYGVAITRVTLDKIINAIIPLPPPRRTKSHRHPCRQPHGHHRCPGIASFRAQGTDAAADSGGAERGVCGWGS